MLSCAVLSSMLCCKLCFTPCCVPASGLQAPSASCASTPNACAYTHLAFTVCWGVTSQVIACGGKLGWECSARGLLIMCSAVQTQDQTLLLEGTNSYRRAIQYQQLDKLQRSSNGTQGFHVQVAASAFCCLYTWGMLACVTHPIMFVGPTTHLVMHSIPPSFMHPSRLTFKCSRCAF